MTTAIAQALNLGEPQDWPLKEAEAEWGYEMANYGLGSNSWPGRPQFRNIRSLFSRLYFR